LGCPVAVLCLMGNTHRCKRSHLRHSFQPEYDGSLNRVSHPVCIPRFVSGQRRLLTMVPAMASASFGLGSTWRSGVAATGGLDQATTGVCWHTLCGCMVQGWLQNKPKFMGIQGGEAQPAVRPCSGPSLVECSSCFNRHRRKNHGNQRSNHRTLWRGKHGDLRRLVSANLTPSRCLLQRQSPSIPEQRDQPRHSEQPSTSLNYILEHQSASHTPCLLSRMALIQSHHSLRHVQQKRGAYEKPPAPKPSPNPSTGHGRSLVSAPRHLRRPQACRLANGS
jgi:hypothetical protein